MKKLLTLLITSFVFIGCDVDVKHSINFSPLKVISTVYLSNGICKIEVTSDEISSFYFKDSCNKYSVGDTITFKK